MLESGYLANQFLIVYPGVLIEGDHAPTRISLESMDRNSNVLVVAHTAPAPVSAMASNLLSLANFSAYGPASTEELPVWKKESEVFPPDVEGQVTIFEVLVPQEANDEAYEGDPDSIIDWDELANPLVRACRAINLYLIALRVVFESNLSLLPQGNLQGPILHRMCRVEETEVEEVPSVSVRPCEAFAPGLGGTRPPDIDNEVIFDEDKTLEFELVLQDIRAGNRILASKERMVAAHTSLHLYGDLTGSSLESATATEMFLDTVLIMLFWESSVIELGFSDSNLIVPGEREIEPFKSGGSLTKRIKSNFNSMLGGEPWSVDRGPIGDWYRDCYLLRHRVIHGGYSPKFRECINSNESAAGLISFVLDAVVKKKTEFPRTTWLLLGQDGLEKRCQFSHKYREKLKGIRYEEPDWRKSYVEYRNEISWQMLND